LGTCRRGHAEPFPGDQNHAGGRLRNSEKCDNYLEKRRVGQVIVYARQHFQSRIRKGDNQDVFYYQIDGNEESVIMLMCFYGGTNFLVHFGG
jgi:hypothetical protein